MSEATGQRGHDPLCSVARNRGCSGGLERRWLGAELRRARRRGSEVPDVRIWPGTGLRRLRRHGGIHGRAVLFGSCREREHERERNQEKKGKGRRGASVAGLAD